LQQLIFLPVGDDLVNVGGGAQLVGGDGGVTAGEGDGGRAVAAPEAAGVQAAISTPSSVV